MAVRDSTAKPRIVVFGGTFDPVHNGHIAIARCLRDELRAKKVLMVPAGQPWLRDGHPVASPQDRLRLVELAIRDEDGIEASDVDIVRQGTTYSIDTIRDLRAIYDNDHEFILAMGTDAASTLPRWYRYGELIAVCTIAVVERPGAQEVIGQHLPTDTISVRGPMIDVSASEVRRLYAQEDIATAAYHVPVLTHRFIIENGLYRCDTTQP